MVPNKCLLQMYRSVRQTELSPHVHTHTQWLHIHPHTHTNTPKVDNLIQLPTHSPSQPLFVSAPLFSLQIAPHPSPGTAPGITPAELIRGGGSGGKPAECTL